MFDHSFFHSGSLGCLGFAVDSRGELEMGMEGVMDKVAEQMGC